MSRRLPAVIDTSPFRGSHMKEPRGVGSWAFSTERNGPIENVAFSPCVTFALAKRWARAHFSGAVVIYVQP